MAISKTHAQQTRPQNKQSSSNGFPCKNPSNISASDFKTSLLNHKGDIDNFHLSSVTLAAAAKFSGLNTLRLSTGKTALEVDGIVIPHSHQRAYEMIFVSKGVVIAGFIDTKNKLFQRVVREGDVFVFSRDLLHYCLNDGFEVATVFSVFNSQNPSAVGIADAMFRDMNAEVVKMATTKLVSLSEVEEEGYFENVNLFEHI